jgi:probable F420-dependent oxidoreductase
MDLGTTGIWSTELARWPDRGARQEAAAELEALGYGTLWFPGGGSDGALDHAAVLLEATERVPVATGILNIWMEDAHHVAREHHGLQERHGGRLLLGLGASHARLVRDYSKPYSAMVRYLDDLDASDPPVPHEDIVLAALGPRMLALSRDRTAGAHPYLVDASHTATAREILGDGPVLAPEQAVVLETDPARARELARGHLERYLEMPNYTNNWRRLGYTDEDVAAPGSDRLVDGLVAWGDEAAIAARVAEHRDAGADHVCIQVIHGGEGLPLAEWRRLAGALPTD